ncbi:MAG: hypothetical protein AAFX44_12225 [Pseudomonadota bacterium]
MAIDYRNYSLAELEEALATIRADQHPENYDALQAEIARRQQSGEYREADKAAATQSVQLKRSAGRIRFWLALYLIATAPLVALNQSYSGVPPLPFSTFAYIGFGMAYCLALVAACVALLLKKAWAGTAVAVLMVVQLIKISSPALVVDIGGPINVLINVAEGLSIGASFQWAPGILVQLGSVADWYIGIDLFAAFVIGIFSFGDSDDAAVDDA